MKSRNGSRWICGNILFLFCLTGIFINYPVSGTGKFVFNDSQDINPYIVSILALNEVERQGEFQEVNQFILWYFSKLNYPDRHGLTGTIYDYIVRDGLKHSTGRYDSVDGYAGLFLHLIHRYVLKTGDIEIVRNNWDKIEDIAYLIPFLQDKDGLIRALMDSQVKYLMDNCEAYGGISAYIALRKLVNKDDSVYYQKIRDSIKHGILMNFYDPNNTMFAWAIENEHKSQSSWNRFYPDAYSQLFPIYYDILTAMPDIRDQLWDRFTTRFAARSKTFPVEQRMMYELTQLKLANTN